MKGYWNNVEATAGTIRDGWLATGDIGYLDSGRSLHIVDRIKDLMICSGFNVYPREIEDLLMTHPGVAEAAVVGAQDEKRGESPVAFVVMKPGYAVTTAELAALTNSTLAAYKAVRHVEIVSELPRNASRKVLKTELRKLALECCG
jgi:acyl-CoA synthetase (AMP-forming)/AMP-acid ligase II